MRKDRPSWYVDPKHIRQKTRYTWSDIERKRIYTLRTAGRSVDDIIRVLKLRVNRIQVYNIIRGETNTRKGLCSCGKPLTPKEIAIQEDKVSIKCRKCLKENSELKKRLRRRYLRKGLCGICGRRKHLKGYTTCRKCLSADYRRSYVKGLCGRCHTNPISKKSKALCNTCLELNRNFISAQRQRLSYANSK